MTATTPYADATCAAFNEITQGSYRTTRNGAHRLDEGEASRPRPLWPGVDFRPAHIEPPDSLVVHVTFRDLGDAVFGCRVDLSTALTRGAELSDLVAWHEEPELMAAELVWYLVSYIGASRIEAPPPTNGADVTWLMEGPEVFGPLPT